MAGGRELYLRCLGAIYLMAFSSYYLQYPGLYGWRGLMPVSNKFVPASSLPAAFAQYTGQPCLAVFAAPLGMHVDAIMELSALAGAGLALLAVAGLLHVTVFAGMWLLYLSLMTAGETFLHFQWDIFILETGFISIWYAGAGAGAKGANPPVAMALRWLAFKFMLSSGVVKLTARDSSWTQLTAMEYHFATTCLPTYEAWYFHNMPPWMLRRLPPLDPAAETRYHRLSTAITFFSEIPVVFLFLLPLATPRRMAVLLQLALMAVIMLSGNYNWFNLHYAALMIPVWGDQPQATRPVHAALWLAAAGWVWAHMFTVRLDLLDPLSWFTVAWPAVP